MLNEMNYYTQIIDSFVEVANNSKKSELWKDHLMIELMAILKENDDKEFVTNAIVTLLALFEDHLQDSYFLHSEDVSNLSEPNKAILIEQLKQAVIV